MTPDPSQVAADTTVRPFGFRRMPQHTHTQTDAQAHLFGFKYWHFFDLGTDLLRGALKPVNAAWEVTAKLHPERLGPLMLPLGRTVARFLPVMGVVGEGMHVYGPFQQARKDWQEKRLGTAAFTGLCALYATYTLTGTECVAKEANSRILLKDLRLFYEAWAKEQNISRLSVLNKTLKRRLQALGYEIGLYNGDHCIVGHALKQSDNVVAETH